MANCFENINIPPCVWFEGGDKRNAIASIVAGFLVSDSDPGHHRRVVQEIKCYFSFFWDGGC